ncbi:MAG: GNAT family N-acetyltransferase [Actinomycetes bacterium]
MPVTPADVGSRVSVRRRLGTREGRPQYGDVVGHLESWSEGLLGIRRRDGSVVEVSEDAVVAGKVVPPTRTYTRRPPAAAARQDLTEAADLERVAAAGWPAVETEVLGDWLLRAAGGFTGRANSVLAMGDPGTPVESALARVQAWYAARGLPARAQVVQGSPADGGLRDAGWRVPDAGPHGHEVLVQTAGLADVGQALASRAGLGQAAASPAPEVRLDPDPDEAWLRVYRGGDPLPPEAVQVLAGHPRVRFASVGDDPRLAVGRVAVDGTWAGLTAVEVVPALRRRGYARAVVAELLGWAADHGARHVYLQVSAGNPAGLRFWARLGFRTHHTYVYRVPEGT